MKRPQHWPIACAQAGLLIVAMLLFLPWLDLAEAATPFVVNSTLDQADATLLARDDDEHRDDDDKADQALKHGGSPKPGQLSLTFKCGGQTARKIQRAARLAAGKIEHVSVPKASSLPLASFSVASETASVRPL